MCAGDPGCPALTANAIPKSFFACTRSRESRLTGSSWEECPLIYKEVKAEPDIIFQDPFSECLFTFKYHSLGQAFANLLCAIQSLLAKLLF